MKLQFAALGAALAAAFAIGGTAIGQGTTPPPKLTVLGDQPVSGSDKLHTLIALAEWAKGAQTPKHLHEGDEYAVVLEGRIEVITEGQASKIYQAGQSYHNSRGVVHIARNPGPGQAKTSIVLVIDKGAPPQTVVKQVQADK